MICPEYLAAGLETEFTRIQRERMADVPMLNPALEVQAVGFTAWKGYLVGVLITPWFMNLMLFSQEGDEWTQLPTGTRIIHGFPSGSYEFILGEEERIGHYLMYSLFSPVFEFRNQEAAVATAGAVMELLMDEATGGVAAVEEIDRPTLTERFEKPVSRRDLLRGAFKGGKD
jgi:[NiFe] hydrogenase assembly HybE family chaperone